MTKANLEDTSGITLSFDFNQQLPTIGDLCITAVQTDIGHSGIVGHEIWRPVETHVQQSLRQFSLLRDAYSRWIPCFKKNCCYCIGSKSNELHWKCTLIFKLCFKLNRQQKLAIKKQSYRLRWSIRKGRCEEFISQNPLAWLLFFFDSLNFVQKADERNNDFTAQRV